MQSLTAHFRETEAHDRLPFHPSCPICRQTRLTGTLTTGAPVSLRAQALLAAGLLALPGVAPATAAFAAELDGQEEGTAPVAENAPTDPAGTPDFDPGGEAADLPEAAGPPAPEVQAPAKAGAEDSAPVEETPAAGTDEPVVDRGDRSEAPPSPQPPAPQGATTPDIPATPPAPPATTTVETAPTPTADADAPAPAAAQPRATAPRAGERVERSVRRARVRPTRQARSLHRAVPVAPVAATPVTVAAALPAAVPQARGDRAKPGDHSHKVLPGESLWSIASDMLGPEASPAAVAREVHRLWRLNRDRIGTGDPDLLMIATRLTLR